MSESPSAILVRAADLIRDTAALAIAPPWSQSGRSVMDGPDEDHEVALTPTTTTARWIALMSPAVAPAIEATLRAATGMWRLYEGRGWPPEKVEAHVDGQARAALALARSVLGEKEEQ